MQADQLFIGSLKPDSHNIRRQVAEMSLCEATRVHTALSFYAPDQETAALFFVSYYRALFRLWLNEEDFSVHPEQYR